MRVHVNGLARELPEGTTVLDVLELLAVAPQARGVAVALDAEVVPRSAWGEQRLLDGAHVEVLVAIQGG